MARKQVELILAAQNKTGKAFNAVNKNITKLEKSSKRIKSLGNIFSGFVATVGVISSFRAIIEKTREQEAAVAQLEARLESTGGVSGKTSKELQGLASSLQKVTTFGDEAIISMQSMLLTFTNIKGDRFNEATKAILDMSVALKTDLKSASIQVGKALNDPIKGVTALSRSGVQFTETQKDLIKSFVAVGDSASAQGVILEELSVQFGGAAEAAADTFGGALDQLSNAFGDLLEADGGGLTKAKDEIKELTEILQDPKTKEAMDNLTSGAIGFAGGLAQVAIWASDAATGLGESLAISALKISGASDDVVFFEEHLAKMALAEEEAAHQAYLLNPPLETLSETIARIGQEADKSRNLLEELGGVEVGGSDFSDSTDKVLEKLEEERKLLKLSGKERFIYNQIKKAGVDATYEEINAIRKSAEALFQEKEALKDAKKETKELEKTKKDYTKTVADSNDKIKSSSFGVFGKEIEEAEDLKEKTEEATKAKHNFLAATSQGGKDTTQEKEEKRAIDLTPEEAKEKAKEIKAAMQQEFDIDPVQVRVKVPTKNEISNDPVKVSSFSSKIGGLNSGLSSVSISRDALKEGSKL